MEIPCFGNNGDTLSTSRNQRLQLLIFCASLELATGATGED